jgi:hypothetical protein
MGLAAGTNNHAAAHTERSIDRDERRQGEASNQAYPQARHTLPCAQVPPWALPPAQHYTLHGKHYKIIGMPV